MSDLSKDRSDGLRTVVLVAPHFIPSFLPSVHRSRLWAYHLEEFGWKPIILTTDPGYYECQISDDMLALLPEGLEVIRTKALPTKPIRLVGDIGFRSIWWYRQALDKLAKEKRIDFLHFTVPAYSPALLGPGFTKRTGIPYGIDYIDPWIPETPRADRVFSKHWFVQRLNRVLEPIAVSRARLITGINRAYFESVFKRHPYLLTQAESAGMPYGGSECDYEALSRRPRRPFLFEEAGCTHLIYAGALLPKAFTVADRLLQALALLKKRDVKTAKTLRVHFVGTGTCEGDPTKGHTVKPFIEKYGLHDMVSEMPSRIGYLDVLSHLQASAGILVIGSTEKHYSPSKIYQSVMSRRPVFALLHEESTAAPVLRKSKAGRVITFREDRLPDVKELEAALREFLQSAKEYDPATVDWEAFRAVSAKESARVLAEAMDRALIRSKGDTVAFP
jgi:hypothetical protein